MMSPTEIQTYLPDAPEGYSYEVEQVSKLIARVWLHHHKQYLYKQGEPVKTVYCFVKGKKVYPPANAKHAKARSLCSIVDLSSQSPYTTLNTHDWTVLTD